ncbi:MAG: ferrous iron transport protein B [Ruminococcus sp.]|nr:ferrous iron transport protein B [Ruminococcus sp.]
MGLTKNSVGLNAVDSKLNIKKLSESDKVIAVAGNPNVGKSTLFNNLTGMNQHTGNWPGKTVTNAQGYCKSKKNSYVLVDIPGTYSLMAHSAEEEIARNFICFGNPDAVVVVCDATCLERNLNLVLQTTEMYQNVIVCVNLLDEAKRRNIKIDLKKLSERLGVRVIGTVARRKKSLDLLLDAIDHACENEHNQPLRIKYIKPIEDAISIIEPCVKDICKNLSPRWIALRLLEPDSSLINELNSYLGFNILENDKVCSALETARLHLESLGITTENLQSKIVSCIVLTAEDIALDTVKYEKNIYSDSDRRIDRILTSKITGFPIMLLMLGFIFWLTIVGANYPSKLLSDGLFYIQDRLTDLFYYFNAPEWLHGAVVLGIYRVVAWIVSVMLPPMAIFFPLFTLLEDSGYLPRIAYNLDKPFKKCSACGKQALTMAMGFGCNSAGIVGCRIIDSPRERLIAMITNSFVPCNGRYPALIALLSMFFVGTAGGFLSSVYSALLLVAIILIGIFMTFFTSFLLSKTILKGVPSSFTLELPPYRKPQFLKVIVHSIFDRTLFVLARAVIVAIPSGLVIWLSANIYIGNSSVLNICADFLDPFAEFFGLDGVILIAFILGMPANEIVIPIMIMAYMSKGSLIELNNDALYTLFVNNGWTRITAVNVMLFSLMHWPCSTTLLTIKKESGSIKWTLLSLIIPTIIGLSICFIFTSVTRLFI